MSYKNDVLLGGVVGQDSSRGNPFPQNAVQEFRVLTQNFKAEFEKASSAAITAVTKSGGNLWAGDVFLLYQDKNLVAQDIFAEERGEEKPTYERFQGGLSLGGPIIADKMSFFAPTRTTGRTGTRASSTGAAVRAAQDLSPSWALSRAPSAPTWASASSRTSLPRARPSTSATACATRRRSRTSATSAAKRAPRLQTDVNTATLRHLPRAPPGPTRPA